MKSFFAKLALAAVFGVAGYGANIAPEGIGLIGVNDATITDLGTPLAHAGAAASVNDGNPSTRVDTFGVGGAQTKSYVGVQWLTPRYDQVTTLTLTLATFGDGGWFGPNGSNPGAGGALTESDLHAPVVQVTTNGGTNWVAVAATSDYVTALTGSAIGGAAPAATFTLATPATLINGIRLIGDNGGPADGNGFLGVFELEVESAPGADSDTDGLPDVWELANGLLVGTNDAADDPDGDGLSNAEEYAHGTNPKVADTDGDGLNDGVEVNTSLTNPLLVDTDGDGLSDGQEVNVALTDPLNADSDDDGLSDGVEVNTRLTNPNNPDTDGDGFSDGLEVAQGSDPKNPDSIPENFAIGALGGFAGLGVKNGLDGEEEERYNAGTANGINDGLLTTHVDDWNGNAGNLTAAYTHSFVQITWQEPVPVAIARVELTMAAFLDGGWFGKNNAGPGAGQPLTAAHLAEPIVQVKTNGAPDWTTVAMTSDYTNKLLGFRIGGGAQPNPTSVKVTFTLAEQATNLVGIRILGTEGGTASGGFIGVFDMSVRPGPRDADFDGMEDSWERLNGLIVGTNDAAGDLDNDGLTNLAEFLAGTNPQDSDSDHDGLLDGAEVARGTKPLVADTDGDGLTDGAEVNTHQTDPLNVDSDGDLFRDGVEITLGTNPKSASSKPSNIALIGAGILGVKPSLDDPAQTFVFNAGASANINDGNPNTVVDSFNLEANSVSFVGIIWTNTIADTITNVVFTDATFFDGGWFGVNGIGPGASGSLSSDYLVEPDLQTTTDHGATWTTVAHVSDYLTAGDGHVLPVAFGAPTRLTATFTPATPITGVNGIRLAGTEGGNAAGSANGGFLGVFEFEVNATVTGTLGLRLGNLARTSSAFSLQFDTVVGKNYVLLAADSLTNPTWTPVGNAIPGDGTRKTATDNPTGSSRFYQVRVE